jgi:transglutaminase-like putative cysteine protease
VRSAVRTIAVATPALVVVGLAWLRLEQPAVSLWRAVALLALALGVAVLPGRWLRVAGAVAATVAAARIAVGVDFVPWRLTDPGSGFGVADSLSSLGTKYGNGFSDFYGTHLPFDPRVHVAMDELVLSGAFIFAVAVTLLVAARKPVWSALALLVGAGWPATLLGPSRGVAMGAAILGAALVVLAGLGSRRVTALALPAAAVVAAGAVAVGSATAARHGLVHWQSWNLAHVVTGGRGADFVWDAQYGGIQWPKHPSVVLQVESARAPTYLRAAVLDDFRGDAWSVGLPRPSDSLEPAVALRPQNQTTEIVTVEGFADPRLVGGSIPIRFSAGKAQLNEPEPGFASLSEDPPRGFRYIVWSYTARPTETQLAGSAPAYPSRLRADGLLDVGDGVTVPPFGTPHRFAAVRALVGRDPGLDHYLQLANLAEDVAGGSRTPYEAVSRLEDWFVSSGGFSYSNHPTVVNPPLVGFVTQTQSGYCQYFAGAMALMLRYLGIPARVAVGFAGGTYSSHKHAWLVTDREAHAWVEVWFKGYGWLPFDPTPAVPGAAPRQTLAGVGGGGRTAAGPSAPFANVPANPGGGSPRENAQDAHRHGVRGPHSHALSAQDVNPGGGGGGSDRSRPVLILLLVLAAAAVSIVAAKAGVRMSRRVRRDPRRVAAACREELASFLVDQRVEVPRSATLAELGDLVQREFGVRTEPFVAAATAARFGPAEGAGAAARVARRELRDLLAAARRSLTRSERLRGLFSLRSLTRPARPVDASASLGSGMPGSAGS